MNRQFVATAPNQLWVADLTYIRTWSGWVYAAFVLDVCSRRIMGWQTSTSLRTQREDREPWPGPVGVGGILVGTIYKITDVTKSLMRLPGGMRFMRLSRAGTWCQRDFRFSSRYLAGQVTMPLISGKRRQSRPYANNLTR